MVPLSAFNFNFSRYATISLPFLKPLAYLCFEAKYLIMLCIGPVMCVVAYDWVWTLTFSSKFEHYIHLLSYTCGRSKQKHGWLVLNGEGYEQKSSSPVQLRWVCVNIKSQQQPVPLEMWSAQCFANLLSCNNVINNSNPVSLKSNCAVTRSKVHKVLD